MHTLLRTTILLSTTTLLLAGGKNTTLPPSDPIPVIESYGFYLGGGYSYFKLEDSDTQEEFTANGATLIAGYEISPYLSIEGRYTKSADIDYDKGKLDKKNQTLESQFSNIALYAKLQYSISNLTPYLLLGYGQSKISKLVDSDREESGFQYGVGVSLRASENLSLFADYVRVYDDKGYDGIATAEDQEINLVTIGMTYHF